MTYTLSISIVSLCLFANFFPFYLDRSIETTRLHRREVSNPRNAIISNLSTVSMVEENIQ